VLLKWKVALGSGADDSGPAVLPQTLKSPQVVDYLGASKQTWLSFAVFLVPGAGIVNLLKSMACKAKCQIYANRCKKQVIFSKYDHVVPAVRAGSVPALRHYRQIPGGKSRPAQTAPHQAWAAPLVD
jgi:hypothetical protein